MQSWSREGCRCRCSCPECVASGLSKLHLWRAGTDKRARLVVILHKQYSATSNVPQRAQWSPRGITAIAVGVLATLLGVLAEKVTAAVYGVSAMTIRALVFDAYGTLYDVQSALAKAEALCPAEAR
jgi:hypothetical protein